MRVVLDANILVSALLTPGGEAEAIRRQVEDRFTLLLLRHFRDKTAHLLRQPFHQFLCVHAFRTPQAGAR